MTSPTGPGALTALPLALRARFGLLLRAGDFAAAVSVGEQMEALTEAVGSQFAPDLRIFLAVWRGREEDVARIIDEATDELELRGEGQWLSAVPVGVCPPVQRTRSPSGYPGVDGDVRR